MVLSHLISQIHAKGTIINGSTDAGEGLHPQSKQDWRGTNRQPNVAEIQVSIYSIISAMYLYFIDAPKS